jgi:uncharacterized membrane protein AbrB (regulator of aidB expression)
MSFFSGTALLPIIFASLPGWIAANICVWLNIPLPQLIGPMFATAAAHLANIELHCPVLLREAGQWQSDRPRVVFHATRSRDFGFIWWCHRSRRRSGCRFIFDGSWGAFEMADLGERNGAVVERIAAAHSLRIMLAVGIIRFGIRLWRYMGWINLFRPHVVSSMAGWHC